MTRDKGDKYLLETLEEVITLMAELDKKTINHNMEESKEYYAFISYKREDEKWAKWLQHKLEHYKFPTNLNGRTDLPKNIRPTFRDVTDLKPGLLAEEINNALLNSEWLIVVCSPRAAKSPWVCKEAQAFIDLGRADHIIPFVIEGNPFSDDIATECYPEALLNLTGSKEILAANINEMGRDAAVIKVIARMFGLRFDTLWNRHKREKKTRHIIIIAMLSVIVPIVIIMVIGIEHSFDRKNVELQQTSNTIEKQNKIINENKALQIIQQARDYMLQGFPELAMATLQKMSYKEAESLGVGVDYLDFNKDLEDSLVLCPFQLVACQKWMGKNNSFIGVMDTSSIEFNKSIHSSNITREYSPDGSYYFIIEYSQVSVYESINNNKKHTLVYKDPRPRYYYDNGHLMDVYWNCKNHLCVIYDSIEYEWNVGCGPSGILLHSNSEISVPAINDDGTMVSAICTNGDVHIWRIPDGKHIEKKVNIHFPVDAAFTHNDRQLWITTSWGGVACVDIVKGNVVYPTAFEDQGERLCNIHITPDDKYCIIDFEGNMIKFFYRTSDCMLLSDDIESLYYHYDLKYEMTDLVEERNSLDDLTTVCLRGRNTIIVKKNQGIKEHVSVTSNK